MNDGEITIGELRRRLDRLERATVSKEIIDARHLHAEEWRAEHDARHSNQMKMIAASGLGIIAKIVGDWIAAGGP